MASSIGGEAESAKKMAGPLQGGRASSVATSIPEPATRPRRSSSRIERWRTASWQQKRSPARITIMPATSPAIWISMGIATKPAKRRKRDSITTIPAISRAIWTSTDIGIRVQRRNSATDLGRHPSPQLDKVGIRHLTVLDCWSRAAQIGGPQAACGGPHP